MTTQAKVENLLASIKSAQQKPLGDPRLESLIGLEKSTFTESMSATSGLTFYDLEVGAKLLYPVLTPLRNMIPRVSGKGGIQANWRAITAINTAGLRFGVSASNRGGVLAVATQDYTATYKGIGVETSVDFEAQYAGQGFDDIRALAAKTGLEALMLGEEAMILGGDATTPLGTTPTPSLSASTSGGSLATATLSVICVALTLDGIMNATIAGGIQGQITRANADGTSDTFGGGAAKQSSNATVSVTGPTGSVSASVAAVAGALGYAWFWGAAGSEALGAITSINSIVIEAAASGTQTGGFAGFERQFGECARLRRAHHSGGQIRLRLLHLYDGDGHRRHRHAAHRRRLGRDRRDRSRPLRGADRRHRRGMGQCFGQRSLRRLLDVVALFLPGTTPQSVWSYLSANFPSQALSYSGTAILVDTRSRLARRRRSIPTRSRSMAGSTAAGSTARTPIRRSSSRIFSPTRNTASAFRPRA